MTRPPSPKSLAYWQRVREAPRSEAGKQAKKMRELRIKKRAFRQLVKDHMLEWITEHEKHSVQRFYANSAFLPMKYKLSFISKIDRDHPGNTYTSGMLTIIRAAAKALVSDGKLQEGVENMLIPGTKRGVYPVKYYEVKKDE